MTVEQIANRLADYCCKDQFTQALQVLYAHGALSIEPFEYPGFEMQTNGLKAMLAKDEKFSAM